MWYEARLKPGLHPYAVYRWLGPQHLHDHHHFWDEPWWPGAYVVRLWSPTSALDGCPAVDHVVEWDATPDEQLYGTDWGYVRQLFQAASDLSPLEYPETEKLVHCVLNAQGMTERDEARFVARFLWHRLTIKLRWRLYLRRRYEREQRKAAA